MKAEYFLVLFGEIFGWWLDCEREGLPGGRGQWCGEERKWGERIGRRVGYLSLRGSERTKVLLLSRDI